MKRFTSLNNLVQKMQKSTSQNFAGAKLGTFFQEMPVLQNPYETDGPLQRHLKRLLPPQVFQAVESDLKRFGTRLVDEIDTIGRECEQNPATLRTFDAYGKRTDKLITSEAWRRMKTISAEEGLVACGYEKRFGEFDRLFQYAKLYMYAPSGGLYSCPLAMTDGAAKVISEMKTHDLNLKKALARLISRDPDTFWTSGQWMTEKRGGSDVAGGTETVAVLRSDGLYDLFGYKWFSSATDADMTLTLARPVANDNEQPVQGTKGLSLFYVQVRDAKSKQLNNIEIVRLKDKLGTRQLPTAELLLDGAIAQKISTDGRGVASIAGMLNITRIHNAIAAVAAMRRILSLSRDYMHKRTVFGKTLVEYPLHLQTLARMEVASSIDYLRPTSRLLKFVSLFSVETRGNLALMFEVAKLLGLQENNKLSDRQSLLIRLLTPLLKLYSGKMAVPLISEGLESFGGLGYLEDTGLPSILRDAQVLPIWEGTTNVLSLDVLRHLAKEGAVNVLSAYKGEIEAKVGNASKTEDMSQAAMATLAVASDLLKFAESNVDKLELAARDFAMSLARCYIGALLLEHASSREGSDDDVETALRWCQVKHMRLVQDSGRYGREVADLDKSLLLDSYKSKI